MPAPPSEPSVLPTCGAVLGIDVGSSPLRRSSAVCRLDWTAAILTWTIRRFRACDVERHDAITTVAGGATLLAAALDGPLCPGFGPIDHYRAAERLLTRRIGRKIGKPGVCHVPSGRALNAAANACARTVLDHTAIARARHATPIDAHAIAEAFPSSFLGTMLTDPAGLAVRRGDRSDIYYTALTPVLADLLSHLLPGRRCTEHLATITNHDDRAALVCAISALCVAGRDYTAVGDADGWVILPPPAFLQPWARDDLLVNAAGERTFYVGGSCSRA